jgi:hypothetical protein
LPDFLADRLVLWRNAAHSIGDSRVDEAKPVIRPGRVYARGEAETRKGGVQEIAGKIACERTAGAICALHAGGKSDDQQSRRGWPERWHRSVVPVRLFLPQVMAKRDKPRTARAFPADLQIDGIQAS